jgi:ribbon-helix-helix CopG family protein
METTSKAGETLTTRSIEAKLSDEDLRRLDERARRAGVDRSECVGLLIRKGLETPPAPEETVPAKTLDEIFAPVHQEFAESGMTQEDLYQFLEEVREEVWQEKQ